MKNSLYSEDDLLAMQEEIGLGSDQLLIGNEEVIAQFIKMMFVLVGILLMVLVSGYLFIYNTMYISVSKDIRYYGQLKTIGITTTQLRRVVWHQIFINSVTGIPTGLILAAEITRKIIPHVLILVNQEFESYEIVSARLWVYAPEDYKEDIEEYKKNPKKSSLYQTGFISVDREGFEHINVELIEVKYEEAYSEETEEQVKAVLADKKKIISHDSKRETYQDLKGLETQAEPL